MSFDVILPFLKTIRHLLELQTVSEIMVNPDASIWIEENGEIELVPKLHFEEGALETGLEVIANRFGKKLDADSPILNLRLPDGSRMAAMIPPVVNPRPAMTIRKFSSRNFTVADLIHEGMVSEAQAVMLGEAVRAGRNILIAGGTGVGKTTLLNVLADAIPDRERILIIEDTAELHIRKPHLVSVESQTDTHHHPVSFDDLLKAVLRHRPDRIVVGEVRGTEARTLLDAMNTGHRGALATVHASGVHQALRRFATLTLRALPGMGLQLIEDEVNRCLDLVVYIDRQSGRRTVQEILEVDTLRILRSP